MSSGDENIAMKDSWGFRYLKLAAGCEKNARYKSRAAVWSGAMLTEEHPGAGMSVKMGKTRNELKEEYDRIVRKLSSFKVDKGMLGTERMARIMSALGNPQKKYLVVHVAGTNGKGSVCSILASILRRAGLKVGMYTSPHLVRFTERIRVNGREITGKEFVSLYRKIRKLAIRERATPFETLTAMAFLYFREKKCDAAVVEAGLGGRFDATNVARGDVCVITNIGIEHTSFLGKSISSIAREKAGIIKKGSVVVTGAEGEALRVILEKARKQEASVIAVAGKGKDSAGSRRKREIIETSVSQYLSVLRKAGLRGNFQRENAAIAVAAAHALARKGVRIGKSAIKEGVMRASWPGRLQKVAERVVVDCSHNPAGARALAEEFLEGSMKKERVAALVFGAMRDKEYGKMMRELSRVTGVVVLTRAKTRRSCPLSILKKEGEKVFSAVLARRNPSEALRTALSISDGIVLVAGSIYIIGELFKSEKWVVPRKIY